MQITPSAFGATQYDLAAGQYDTRFLGYRDPRAVGDVNGDGWPDLLLRRGCHEETLRVLLGPFPPGDLDPDTADLPGFDINDAGTNEHSCSSSVMPIGDINGDGLDDIVIGSAGEDNLGRTDSGSVYVIFGTTTPESVSLNDWDAGTQGDEGFRIDGPGFSSLVGYHVEGGGDMNGDGLADIIVGSPFYGQAFVVFGREGTDPLDLSSLYQGGSGEGFVVQTRSNDRNTGYSVSGAGDVNGDGLDDVVIGAIGKINQSTGRAYVVFGKADDQPLDVRDDIQGRGFMIKGRHGGDAAGFAVTGGGDINGDGLSDVVVGVPRYTLGCCRGLAYVVFGKTDSEPVKLRKIGNQGFKIRGASKRDYAGQVLAIAGDVNHDGLSDVIVGAWGDDPKDRETAGAVSIVYGKASSDTVRLGHLGDRGIKVIGAKREDGAGFFLAAPGDLDADGTNDVVVGTYLGENSYLIYL